MLPVMATTGKANIHDPDILTMPPGVLFGEARNAQQLVCNKLTASAFGHPLSEADYLEWEEYMSKQALAQNGGVRHWCLYRGCESLRVLATCKTIARGVFVRDALGTREANGYCISSVATHPEHCGQGFATLLLQNFAE